LTGRKAGFASIQSLSRTGALIEQLAENQNTSVQMIPFEPETL
jgi:hypothetical protein